MGNTSLPQSGAAHEENSRDTLSGIQQLPDQLQKRAEPVPVVPPNPLVTPAHAIIGYLDTGHSPSDAT